MQKKIFLIRFILLGILLSSVCTGLAIKPAAISPVYPQDRSVISIEKSGEEKRGISSAGIISSNQIICGSGDVNGLVNEAAPTSDIDGFVSIIWEKRTLGSIWVLIPDATWLDYDPGFIEETTEFRRGCRENIEQEWIYSNVVVKQVVDDINDITILTTDVECKGGADGTATAIVLGGEPNYSFHWSNSATGVELTGLMAGYYQVTVVDANECSMTSEIVAIKEPDFGVEIEKIYSDRPSCPGGSDGIVYVSAFDGIPPYSYSWSNGSTDPLLDAVPAGIYTVVATDSTGCTATKENIVLTEPDQFFLVEETVNTSCFGTSNGAVDVSVFGGTGPYNYIWFDGFTGQSRADLPAGNHAIGIRDDADCIFNGHIAITQPEVLDVSPAIVNNKICKASANIVPSGGTAPYTFEWNDGAATNFITNLCPGFYTVKVADVNGCLTEETLEISADFAKEVIDIKIIVNPFSLVGNIVIKLPYDDFADIQIYTATGQLVESFNHIKPQFEKEINLFLDMDKYSNGIYFVRVSISGLSASEKIVIEN